MRSSQQGKRAPIVFLRQFRVTVTNVGKVLLRGSDVRRILKTRERGESDVLDKEKMRKEWLENIMKSWFSSKVSTEAMMRGGANERVFISALRAN